MAERQRYARLSDEDRDRLRAELTGRIPGWYSPWMHLLVPSLFGLGIFAGCMILLRDVRVWDLAAVPLTWLAANIGEWRAHRYLLHRRTRWATVLYDRHTPEHHMLYVTDDMTMRSRREFRLVLIPAYGIMLIFVVTLLPAALMWLGGLRNVALLFVATEMAYVLSYEWLHLAYHLPPESFFGRIGFIRRLRRFHAIHHDPALMQRWNFNVTVPLWDVVKGTLVASVDEARERDTGAVERDRRRPIAE
jgi:sterol desaturase/sphingolipid hydroxylase (fatty acid hydroxylase superfamily)